jgi:thiol-disulfide isomerase/thioredoxin
MGVAKSGRTTKWVAAAMLAATLGAGVLPNLFGQTAGARDIKTVLADLKTVDAKLSDELPLASMADADFRKGSGQKALPDLQKFTELMGELAGMLPGDQGKAAQRRRLQYMGMRVALGDAEATKELETTAKKEGDEGIAAASALGLGNWWANSKDAAAQGKVLDAMAAVAHKDPASDEVAGTLMIMANSGAANDEMEKRAVDTIKTCLTGPMARRLIDTLASLDQQQQMMGDAEKKQAESLGKPFAISGRTSTDGKFDTASLKGKVVLIDFWATWCGPCRAELPHVKETYAKYHDKGLEMVGVSCDVSDEGLNDFAKDNEMPWVQLREKSQEGAENWHPIAKQYGVLGIPTMFLVDRNGVLRFIDAREGTEEKVAKLLAEPAGAGPAAPATQPAK